jgi:hypothetical protein
MYISKHISYHLRQCKKLWPPYIAAIVSQTVVHGGSLGGSQSVSEGKALLKLYQTLNEWKTDPYISVPKLSMLVDLQQKAGELVQPITSCPPTIILENTLINV